MSAAAVLDDYLDGLLGEVPATGAAPVAAARSATIAAVPAPQQAVAAPVPPAAPAPRPAPAPAAAQPLPPRQTRAQSAQADDEHPATPARRVSDHSSRWLRLRCGDQPYGLELLKVQEVVLPTPLLPLRGTPPAMLGVMNLRGQVVPVMDLGVHLGQAPLPGSPATRIVVLEEHGETLGLRVSCVEDVVTLGKAQIESPENARVGRSSVALFRGIARLSSEPMILLDASALLTPDDSILRG